MRAHLLKCLQEQHIKLFPVLKKQSRRLAVLCTLEVEIFCLCCLPEEGTMIECSTCLKWFHVQFVEHSGNIMEEELWYCRDCRILSIL